MAIFNGILPEGVDLSQFVGIPDHLKGKSAILADYDPERDRGLLRRFFTEAYFQSGKTRETGFPQFSSEIFIEIWIDASTKFTQIVKCDEKGEPLPAYAKWTTRFPEEWERFRKNRQEGYSLTHLKGADKAIIASLEAIGVRTIDALVDLQGEVFEHLPGLSALRDEGKRFLTNADELMREREKNRLLQEQLAKLEKSSKRPVLETQ
jgi:hypothetical protein